MTGPESRTTPSDDDRGQIVAYLTSREWQDRLTAARAARARVLAAKAAAAGLDATSIAATEPAAGLTDEAPTKSGPAKNDPRDGEAVPAAPALRNRPRRRISPRMIAASLLIGVAATAMAVHFAPSWFSPSAPKAPAFFTAQNSSDQSETAAGARPSSAAQDRTGETLSLPFPVDVAFSTTPSATSAAGTAETLSASSLATEYLPRSDAPTAVAEPPASLFPPAVREGWAKFPAAREPAVRLQPLAQLLAHPQPLARPMSLTTTPPAALAEPKLAPRAAPAALHPTFAAPSMIASARPAMAAPSTGTAATASVRRLNALEAALSDVRLLVHEPEDLAAEALRGLLEHAVFANAERASAPFQAPRTLVYFFDGRDAALADDLALVLNGDAIDLTGWTPKPADRRLEVYLASSP